MVSKGTSKNKMDDLEVYPHFRKPQMKNNCSFARVLRRVCLQMSQISHGTRALRCHGLMMFDGWFGRWHRWYGAFWACWKTHGKMTCVLRIPGAWPGQIQKTTSINGFCFFFQNFWTCWSLTFYSELLNTVIYSATLKHAGWTQQGFFSMAFSGIHHHRDVPIPFW